MDLKQQVSEKIKISASETGDVEPLHVLAVDDSLIDRRVIEKLLKISAYKVTVVDSGTKALEFLGISDPISPVSVHVDEATKSESDSSGQEEDQNSGKEGFEVNLIITDYCMPGMTGYELLKKIKGTSSLKEIPVVIMSSENVPTRINTCLAEGAEDFLLKPVRLADVKRLRCHVRQARPNNDSETTSSKRKASSEDFVLGPKSRVRLNKVKVKVN